MGCGLSPPGSPLPPALRRSPRPLRSRRARLSAEPPPPSPPSSGTPRPAPALQHPPLPGAGSQPHAPGPASAPELRPGTPEPRREGYCRLGQMHSHAWGREPPPAFVEGVCSFACEWGSLVNPRASAGTRRRRREGGVAPSSGLMKWERSLSERPANNPPPRATNPRPKSYMD